ncbi:MAG: hypothetical protein ACKVU1_09735 [bacterium]
MTDAAPASGGQRAVRAFAPFPLYGYAGLAGLVAAQWLLFAGFAPVRMFFTPLAWTCYILIADAAVFSLRGKSQLSSGRAEFARCAFASIPIWLIFEAYNLRLANWEYIGLPEAAALRYLGYAWSFATILPGLFETSDLIVALADRLARSRGRGAARRPPVTTLREATAEETSTFGTRASVFAFGVMCLLFPLIVPRFLAQYLFALVWIGFIFVLHPLNSLCGRWSPFHEWANHRRTRFVSLLAGGLGCGVLWEFWNYWAGAKWIYVFPIFQESKLFEMPIPGYLGFPPFAVECFMIYDLLAGAWRGGWGSSEMKDV